MTEKPHNVPDWFIPEGTTVIANEPETEEIEETGRLDAPLCPHCGEPYEREDDGRYIHEYNPVDGDSWGGWERDERTGSLTSYTQVKPATWCDRAGEKRRDRYEPFGFDRF